MATISDLIEQFIKRLMGESDTISISRNELAQYFDCAPSQINYVLATRFSLEHGFVIESKRGGGGFITLIKISPSYQELLKRLDEYTLKEGLTYQKAVQLIKRLCEEGIINQREAEIIKSAISDKALIVPTDCKDILRSNILKSILAGIFKEAD
ncbi:MAG TPA: CtsR family transcriptional regulator [Clostridia bacterium]